MRSVVVDRRLHLQIRTDLLLDLGRRSRGLLVLVLALTLLGLLLGRPLQGVVAGLGGVLVWAAVHWVRFGRSMRHGLDVGQRVAVSHRVRGDAAVVVTDSTGEVVLGRGSALVITRFRGIVTFYGRQLSFVLPTGMLTEDEASFLEGSGAAPEGGLVALDDPPSLLPLSLTITEEARRRTSAAVVRAITTSADVLTPVVVALGFLVLGAILRFGPLVIFGCVVAAVSLLTAPRVALRARSTVRLAYPVGRTVHAEVSTDSFTTELATVTHAVRWDTWDSRRVTEHAVLLRHRGRFMSHDVFSVYPRDLFDDAAIRQLAAAVPRTF